MARPGGTGQDGPHDQGHWRGVPGRLTMTRGEVLRPATTGRGTPSRRRQDHAEVALAAAAFAVLCVAVLAARPFLVEPDDYAYRASIVAHDPGALP